jgi:hypothetical protein
MWCNRTKKKEYKNCPFYLENVHQWQNGKSDYYPFQNIVRVTIVYSKSEYTLESVSMSGRPVVYTITLQRIIWLWWNFVHRTVLLISRSSSKVRTIGPHLPELLQKNVVIPVGLFHSVPPKKTQVSPNRPKGILSCRAWKVVFVVKKSAINIVPLEKI